MRCFKLFFDAVKCGQGFAKYSEKALAYIQKVYFLEDRLREQNLSSEEFVTQRKLRILPILNEFHDWMVSILLAVVPELKYGRALNYALNSWQHILNYIECPYIYLLNCQAKCNETP